MAKRSKMPTLPSHTPYTSYSTYKPSDKPWTGMQSLSCIHTGGVTSIQLLDGGVIAGAQALDVDWLLPDLRLIVDFSNTVSRPASRFVKSVTGLDDDEPWLALNDIVRQPVPIVSCSWPDGVAPWPLTVAFWRRLAALLPKDGRTVFCCAGGHGRTGTSLAAVLIALGNYTADDAIATIRRVHCCHAIETAAQERYLESLALPESASVVPEDAGEIAPAGTLETALFVTEEAS